MKFNRPIGAQFMAGGVESCGAVGKSKGQRIADKVAWARDILKKYGDPL